VLFSYTISRCLFVRDLLFFFGIKMPWNALPVEEDLGEEADVPAPIFAPQNPSRDPSFSLPFSVPFQVRNSIMLSLHLQAAWLLSDRGSKNHLTSCEVHASPVRAGTRLPTRYNKYYIILIYF
jgi:hypothetical protein